MALSQLDISLQDAIEAAGLVCLPDKLTPGSTVTWLKAIGLVLKNNGTKGYVLMEYDGANTKIKRDFGTSAQIIDTLEIYPYETLERRFIPKLSTDEDTVTYLKKMLNNEAEVRTLLDKTSKSLDTIAKDSATVKKMVLQCAIKQAQQTLDDELKYKKLIELKRHGNEKDSATETIRQTRRGRKPTNR
jgi:hypothetical protein